MEDNKPAGIIDPTNQRPANPVKYFAQWKSTEKCFVFYDKVNKIKDVHLPMPFTFIPLAKAICIKGYNEPEQMSLISNEVEDQSKDILIVRGYVKGKKAKVLAKGLWADIKKDVTALDGSWTESIYGAAKDAKGNLELINVQLNGSGITHWFSFLKENKIFGSAVTIKEFSNEKKGVNKYHAPKFELMKISEKTNLQAAELQKQILAYLKEYYASNEADSEETAEQPATTAKQAAPTAKTQSSKSETPFKGNPKEAHTITETEEEEDIHANDGAPNEF